MKTYRFSGRIAVIGYGAETPIGTLGPGDESFWKALLACQTAIKPLSFKPADYGIEAKVASEHTDFDFGPYAKQITALTGQAITGPIPASIDKAIQLGLASTLLACQMAEIDLTQPNRMIGVKGGTGLGAGAE